MTAFLLHIFLKIIVLGQNQRPNLNSFCFCRFWFYFSIENTQQDQRIIFNLVCNFEQKYKNSVFQMNKYKQKYFVCQVNISKSRNLLTNGLTPVVKSTSRCFQRLSPNSLLYHFTNRLYKRSINRHWRIMEFLMEMAANTFQAKMKKMAVFFSIKVAQCIPMLNLLGAWWADT